MPSAWISSTLLLAGVLALGGVSKFRSPGDVRAALQVLPLPRVVRRPWVATVLPALEAALALGLLLTSGWALALVAAVALALTLSFLALVTTLVQRPAPSRRCSGGRSWASLPILRMPEPVAWATPSHAPWIARTGSGAAPPPEGFFRLTALTGFLRVAGRVEAPVERRALAPEPRADARAPGA